MRYIFLLVVLAGCVHRPVAVGVPVLKDTYGYTKMDDGSYLVVVSDRGDIKDALDAMGCKPKRLICRPQIMGKYWRVEVK